MSRHEEINFDQYFVYIEEFLTNKKRKYGNIEIETVDQGATCNLCFVEES